MKSQQFIIFNTDICSSGSPKEIMQTIIYPEPTNQSTGIYLDNFSTRFQLY